MSPLPAALRARVPSVVDRVFVRPLPNDPKQAAAVSLQYINALVRDGARDPLVRRTAAQVLQAAGVSPGDRRAAIVAVHDWIQGHMPYQHDPHGIEMLTEARKTLEAIAVDGRYREDCDGMVIAEASMLRSVLGRANVRHIILKGDRRSPTDWSHIFLQAHDGAAWVTLDPIMNGDAPERPKQPVGWHPPRYYGRAVVDPGATGPTWTSMAARDGMAVYQRGPDMTYDLIPAQKERGNAFAYEDDSWMERLPQFHGYFGAIQSGDYAQERGLPKRSGMGAAAMVASVEAALDNRAAAAARAVPTPPGLLQAIRRAFASFLQGRPGANAPIVALPRRGSAVPPGMYRTVPAGAVIAEAERAQIVAGAAAMAGADNANYQAYRGKMHWGRGERVLSFAEWKAQRQAAKARAATSSDTAMVAQMVQAAPQRGVVLSPLEGFGAILSNRFAQGHIPGYLPTTVGEDPRTAENEAYWAGAGAVGGAMRSQAVKTQLYRGGAYMQFGADDVTSTIASLAETIVQTGVQVASLQQLQQLNRARVKAGQPPLSSDQVGLSAPAAHPLGVPTWLIGVGVAVAGAGVWAMTRRKRR